MDPETPYGSGEFLPITNFRLRWCPPNATKPLVHALTSCSSMEINEKKIGGGDQRK